MADLPITSDEGGTPVVITGAVSPYSTVAVAANGSLQTLADITGTGTITALNGSVVATTHGCGSVNFYVTGTWVATLSIQGTVDGTNWFTLYGIVVGTDVVTEFIASDVSLDVPCGGLSQVRLVATAFTSGTASINWNAGAGIKSILAISPVAASFNTQISGAVTTAAPTYTTGTTNPISLDTSGNIRVTVTNAAALSVAQAAISTPWIDDITQWANVTLGSPSAYGTSPGAVNVIGVNAFITNTPTVTANIGTTGGLALDSTLTSGANKVQLSGWLGSTAPTVGQKTMAASIPVTIASDESDLVTSLNSLVASKTLVMQTGVLVTTATTANQVVLTYTVTAGKILYLEYLTMFGYITTIPGNANPVNLGRISFQNPSGTTVIQAQRFHADYVTSVYTFSDPLPIAAGTVIRVVVTPVAATSYTWLANFGGYEV